MASDAFLMRFRDGDVVPIDPALALPVFARFGAPSIGDDGGTLVFAVEDIGEVATLNIDAAGAIESVCIGRFQRTDASQEFVFACMCDLDCSFFDDSLTTIYSRTAVDSDIPPDLLDQIAGGVTHVESVPWSWGDE